MYIERTPTQIKIHSESQNSYIEIRFLKIIETDK